MNRKTFGICCTLFICISLSGCVWTSSLSTQWSENCALATYGTFASHPELNDGKLETVASVYPDQGERVFTLTFPEVRPVRKIIIHNENLFRFDVEYWDAETSAWKTVQIVRKKQDTRNERAQPQYMIDRLNFETHQIRVNILQTVDERIRTSTGYVYPDEKVINIVKGSYHGHYWEWERVLKMAQARIREIEVYHLRAPTSSPIAQASAKEGERMLALPTEIRQDVQVPVDTRLDGVLPLRQPNVSYPIRPTTIQPLKVTPKKTFTGHTEPVTTIAFSPDGRAIASGAWDETIKLWSVDERREIATIHGQSGGVWCVAYNPNGQMLASGHYIGASQGGIVNLWSVRNGELIATFKAPYNIVSSTPFSPDGCLLACASKAGYIKLWEIASQKEIATLPERQKVLCVTFSPDGQLFASGAEAGILRLWSVPEKEIPCHPQRTPRRCLFRRLQS